jgi:uncharacterized OsmC-like protein
MKTLTKTTVNGFKSEEILGTINAIQDNPEIAQFEFRVKNKWVTAGHNKSMIQGFYGGCQEDTSREEAWTFDNGEPPILLGTNEGANPVEFLLHSFAGCMTTTMALHAAARGIQIESIDSSLEGTLDVQGFLGLNDKIRNGYQQIKVNFDIKGDLTEDQKSELIRFAHKSPVFDIITNKVPVNIGLV